MGLLGAFALQGFGVVALLRTLRMSWLGFAGLGDEVLGSLRLQACDLRFRVWGVGNGRHG